MALKRNSGTLEKHSPPVLPSVKTSVTAPPPLSKYDTAGLKSSMLDKHISQKEMESLKNMSYDELSSWMSRHKDMFTGMDADTFKSWVQDNWGQYQAADDARNNLFGVFGESPQYQIPQEVFDQLRLATTTAQAGMQGAEQIRQSTMDTLRSGVEKATETVTGARDEALGLAREDVNRIRDIQQRSRDATLNQAYAGRKEMLAELQRGGDRALDIQRLQAFGGLPGERMTQEQLQANFAATQRAIKERAGGGSGALGAIAQGYGQQVQGQRQLAVDRAQYQAQGMANLAGGEFQQSQRMADAMRQSRLDIAGAEMATAQNMSDAYLATSEYLTNMIGGYARDIADAQFAGANALSSMDYATGQNVINMGYKGASLVGQGLQNVAQQRQQQFAINQYEPYQAQRQFLLNELQRLDPWAVETQMYGDLLGQGYSQYMQGVSGQAQSYTNTGNALANTMAQASTIDWGQYAGENNEENNNSYIGGGTKVIYGNPQYEATFN
jgi:hypothetical protein